MNPALVEADAAYAAGDFRRARALVFALPVPEAPPEAAPPPTPEEAADRAALLRLRRALAVDPLTWVVGAACLAIWLVLVWRVALS